MKINSFIRYRISADTPFINVELQDNITCDSKLKIQFKNEKINFRDKFDLQLILNESSIADIHYYAIIEFEKDEKIINYKDPFPFLNHKSLSPVLKLIGTAKRTVVIQLHRAFPLVIKKMKFNTLKIDVIIDSPSLHPAWDLSRGQRISAAVPVLPGGTVYNLQLEILQLPAQENFIPMQQYIYPNARKAAFVLTDHCDFDTQEKLKLFLYGNNNNGWLGRGLKITKGVFVLGPKVNEPRKNDSLEDAEYASLIKHLYNDGSEIAPHALKSKGQLESETFHSALKKIAALFHAKTWIDHGSYIKYCYSQGAKYNPDFFLIDALKKNGFNSLWSFHDVNIDALNTLNIFSARKFSTLRVWAFFLKYLFKGKWFIAAHYLRSLFHRNYSKHIITDFLIYAMSNIKRSIIRWQKGNKNLFKESRLYFSLLPKFKKYRNNVKLPYNNNDLLQKSEAIFLEDKRPLAQYVNGDLLMFSTFETTHLKDIYNKKAIDNLVKENGTHIGHTYILNDLPYINHIFSRSGNTLRLSEKWVSFLDALSAYVNDGTIWNPTMGEFIDYLILLLNVRITYRSASSIIITNGNNRFIEDYTLVIPSDCKGIITINNKEFFAKKTDQYCHYFVTTLMPLENVIVSY